MSDATTTAPTRYVDNMAFETDGGIAERACLGLIVLATDYTIEHEWRRILAQVPGVALYQSRIRNSNQITPETLRAMEPLITECADVLLPGGGAFDVIAYGCTSAAMAIGEEKVFGHIRKARPGVACTTPITAAFAAFDAFRARRIGVLTPYSQDVNRIVAEYIGGRGYEVAVFGSFNEEHDDVVARISPESVRQAVKRLAGEADIEAMFVSCTSVRLADACADIEAEVGVPVTSSNHAMAWHALRLAGIDDALPAFGRLFTLPLG